MNGTGPPITPESGINLHSLIEFLQAKFPLDQRSLNSDVWDSFVASISNFQQIQLLDVGTGSGSMLRRILQTYHPGFMSLTGLDQEVELLKIAEDEIAEVLSRNGFNLTHQQQKLIGCKQQDIVEFNPACNSLFEFSSTSESYHVITAHAFMDLVPLHQTLTQFFDWLKPGGFFYSTLNYDNESIIFPPYPDSGFEEQVIMAYNQSMEKRQSAGKSTGGAKCGRRLFQTLQQTGFTIIVYGSSDWNIVPINGNYRDQDQQVLRYLLHWIFKEAENNSSIDPTGLQRWYQYRLQQLSQCQLGIIIHQLDILAHKA